MLFRLHSLLDLSSAAFVVAMALSSWLPSNMVVVDAQVTFDDQTVVCHPDAPTVCVGETLKSIQASPNGDYTYWTWIFVSPGEAEIDPTNIGLEVVVSIDQALNECEVTVNAGESSNGESIPCNGCSLIGCDGDSPAIKYDCRNIEATVTTELLTGVGDFGECYPVEDPFVYPFELPKEGGDVGEGISVTVVEGEDNGSDESSSSDDEEEESSNNFIEDVLDSITGESSAHTVVAAVVANGMAMMVLLVGTLLSL